MYRVAFLTRFWPTCGMVHFTSERLISSLYTYEIKIHIKYLLPQVWNKLIVYLPTYTKVKKKWGTLSQNRVRVHNQEPENPQSWVGTVRIKGRFFIANVITID